MSPSVAFRRATPRDAAVLARLMAETFRDTYRLDSHGDCRIEDVETYVARSFGEPVQRAELARDGLVTVLAEVDGAPAGYAQLRLDTPCPGREASREASGAASGGVEVARFYVDRPFHGRGLAWALMDECVRRAPAGQPLWLTVYQRNARAIAFYGKWGFARAGVRTFVMGDDVQDDWLLVRPPGAPVPPAPPRER